ncbi:hypothetical protein BO70DRAFT_398496 [Aspergillus heteromorphus CBS 117.55]|uniref:Uncharacterized protein n=1 Tax=Aspergillus heteromorphus CBS 117.55 TaxID=1448321 RepID=A0A317VL83_9EURO|nr:uncharacterized protein BO70DRAFT_398496 [Aspergillus heteromorphus CBS 117.55]PWY75086.1 hypothetical protein BO70DRAFT_398496 [Aspergillus heteromorphus CBS 117.55]
MSSKQLVVSTRRPRASESALITTNFRGNGRAVANLHSPPPDSSTTLIRGPSHRRTGSTLKTVMRKIFTRKPRDDDSAHSRSDNRSPRSDKSLDKALDKPFPLSNSLNAKPSPPDSTTPTSWEEALKKLEPHPRRRRATLPSLIFSDEESRVALEGLVNSGRPISKRDNSPHANSDPDDVRRRELRQIKRRSRSATALRGMAKDHLMSPIQWRRRSLESCAASTTFGAASEAELERPPTRTTVASAPKPTTRPSFLEDDEDEKDEPELEAPDTDTYQNVSDLVNSMQHDENVTLEQRLTTLEVKMIDLEFAIARMQSGRESPVEPKKTSPTTATRHKRKKSAVPSETRAKSPTDRPESTSTLRPSPLYRSRTLQAPSSTSLHECNSISVEQYSALVMLLRREQNARRDLEHQVTSLRDDIQQLQQMARDSMGLPTSPGSGTMYPIRSMDSQDIVRLRQALGPSPTETSRTERIESDDERPELPPKEGGYQPRWPSSRRVEVSGMI